MDLDDLMRIADRATDHFRLETLTQYLVPEEEEDFAAWKRGERRRTTPENNAWAAELREVTAAGARWWRVRILDYPLTDYSAFELFGYQDYDALGQETFVADRAWHADLTDLHEDFWIFDSTAIRMVYDEEGHFLYPVQCDDIQQYLDIRDRALQHAIRAADYIRKYEPDLLVEPL